MRARIVAEHDDGYEFTALAVVACIPQYRDGSIAKPGLAMMGHIIDPVRLMKDLERMGTKVQIHVADGSGKAND